jgi:hypothetical protein
MRFENRVLRIIFGRKRKEVTGCWRKLHIEELHNLICFNHHLLLAWSNKGRREMDGECNTHGREEKCTHFSRNT